MNQRTFPEPSITYHKSADIRFSADAVLEFSPDEVGFAVVLSFEAILGSLMAVLSW